MRYMLIHAADPDLAALWDDEAQSSFSAWVEETIRTRVNLQGARVRPPADATTVKIRGGELIVTDGPYAETKEQVAGFYLIEARDLNEAIQIAARIPSAPLGTIELRPCRDLIVDGVKHKASRKAR
jgi:hypothetical protein